MIGVYLTSGFIMLRSKKHAYTAIVGEFEFTIYIHAVFDNH